MAWSALRDGIDPSQQQFSEERESVAAEAQAASSSSGGAGAQMRRLQQGPALGKATRELLAERLASLPPVVHSVASADGTRKLLVRLHDGLEVECVLIPMTGGVQHRVREQGHGRQADVQGARGCGADPACGPGTRAARSDPPPAHASIRA